MPDSNPLSDTVQLLRELIQRPSVTPADHDCQQLVAGRLAKAGFGIEHMPFGEVSNLWARIGNSAPLFVFAGHTDVVPTGNPAHWSAPPFGASIIDNHMFGRGAADMKGGVAAMVTACERFVSEHPHFHGSLAILLTSDEEGPAIDGTAKVIRTLCARNETIDYCVLGEPTSGVKLGDTIKHGRRGSLNAHMKVKGLQGHVAYPQLADNPVHRVLPMLAELTGKIWDLGDDQFPPTTLQISNMQAGTGASNVIPGECRVDFNLRYSPQISVDQIKSTVLQLIGSYMLDAKIDWVESAAPFITEAGSLTDAMAGSY